MLPHARTTLFVLISLTLFAAACNNERPAPFQIKDRTPVADRDAPFDPPNRYPGWAYDQPEYIRPAQPLEAEPRVMENDPPHYFTRSNVVMIRCPADYDPEEIPRVAVHWTNDQGFHWYKAGYFGRGQTYFPFEADEDGDYGVRFIGPGQTAAQHTLAFPTRVYHVDTLKPEVEVSIEPEQSWYNVGDTITLSWRAADYHLVEFPVRIVLLMDFSAEDRGPIEIQRDLADAGSITLTLAPETLEHEITFRVEATDRAGNLGLAHSFALQIVDEPLAEGDEAGDLQDASSSSGVANMETHAEDEATVVSDPTPPTFETQAVADDAATPDVLDETAAGTATSDVVDETANDATTPDVVEETTAVSADAPRVVLPFATAVARVMDEASKLIWRGPEPKVFPADDDESSRRTTGGFLDAQTAPADLTRGGPPRPASDIDSEAEADLLGPVDVAVSETRTGPSEVADDMETPVAIWKRSAISAVDLTRGNGLLVPLPATVETEPDATRLATAHPWRVLGDVLSSPIQTVWLLPDPRLNFGWRPVIRGRFLADNPLLRAVAEPPGLTALFAGIPSEDAETAADAVPE